METSYAPDPNGRPDPGEVVWAWVPYEDDPAQGKDRPVLVVGREGDLLACLYLTSKDHDRDADDEARHGRYWMDVGSGGWDREGRPSEVRLDRLLELPEGPACGARARRCRGRCSTPWSSAARATTRSERRRAPLRARRGPCGSGCRRPGRRCPAPWSHSETR